MNNLEIDTSSREKIVNNINTNYFVEAGAGSGKTTVLVERMVNMILAGKDIDKICAITFTKAAASEFYARFQYELSRRDDENCKKALKNLNQCFMGTIDSFCNMILSEHPSIANIPSDASMIDKEEAEELYRKEYSRVLNGEYEGLKDKANNFRKLFYNAEEIFNTLLPLLIGKRNIHFNYSEVDKVSIEKNYKKEKKRLLELLRYLNDHPEYYDKFETQTSTKSMYERLHTKIKDLERLNWDENINDIITILKGIYKSGSNVFRIKALDEESLLKLGLDYKDYFVEHESKGKVSWYELRNDLDQILLERCQTYKSCVILDFITSCIEPISNNLKAQGKLTFEDYLLGLRDLLEEDSKNGGKLIKHIYDRHSFFLIDEFQDTNPLQAEIFFYLTAKKPEANWKDCIPKEGSLFIVGDPKQSIYRFRSADVSSYIKVKELFKGEVGEVLSLTRNFRSSPTMCEWFNLVFSKLLSEDTKTQSKYSEIPIIKKDHDKKTFDGVYKYEVEKDDYEIVTDIIRKITYNPNYLYYDRKNDTYNQIEYKDIMIITPTTTVLDKYISAFKDNAIPVKVEGAVLFNECQALRSVKHLMAYINNPNDKRYKFSAEYLSYCDLNNINIEEYSKEVKDYSPSALFSKIIDDFNIFEYTGVDNAEYLYYALELLREKENEGKVISVEDAIKFIDSLFIKSKDYERTMQLNENSNRVHIANLHKVKGLERQVVILASPKAKEKQASMRIDYSNDIPQGYLFNIGSNNPDSFTNILESYEFKKEKELENISLEEEDSRLLYVAATRAASVLIVSNKVYENTKSTYNPWYFFNQYIQNDIYDYIPKDTLEETIKEYNNPKDYYNNDLYKLNKNEESYIINLPSKIKLKNELNNEEDILFSETQEEVIENKKDKKINPTLVGTIVHRYMELLVLSKSNIDDKLLIENILNEYDANEEYYLKILNNVSKTIKSGGYNQENNIPKDILNELLNAQEVHTELPFCYLMDDKNIWNGVIDLVYKKDDKWHIVDYKTNADPNLLDEKYKGQLDAYIKAFKAMTKEDADAFIYHIDV